MIIYVPVLFAIIGLVMYLICTNAKLAEVGRLMFACGLLAFLLGRDQLIKLIGG